MHNHLTANVLWAASDPARAIMLPATVIPWSAMAGAGPARRGGLVPARKS